MSDNRDWYLCGIKRADEKIESEINLIKAYQANIKEMCGRLNNDKCVVDCTISDIIWKIYGCRLSINRARNRARLYVKIKKNLEIGIRL